MKKHKLNSLSSFLIKNDIKRSKDKPFGHQVNMSEKKSHQKESRLFKYKLSKKYNQTYNRNINDYNQSKTTKLISPLFLSTPKIKKNHDCIKYKLLQSHQKLKYLNDKVIDSFILPENDQRNENSKICKSQPSITKLSESHISNIDQIDKKKLLKKFNKLLLANVNKTKIYSLYMNSTQNSNYDKTPINPNVNPNANVDVSGNISNPRSKDPTQSYRSSVFKKFNKIDHLLMRMTMPQECFEEHLTEKDLIPQDKYTKFKRLLLKKREKVINCLEELKKTQTMNDSLIKVYTSKLLSTKYKYKANLI